MPVREWRGGERYGDEADVYYAEFRGVVRGADPGDQREGLVHRQPARQGQADQRVLHLPAGRGHPEPGARPGQRGLRGRQPGADSDQRRPQVRRRARRRAQGRGLQRLGLGRVGAGRAAPPRRAQPLQRAWSGTSATTGSPRTPRTELDPIGSAQYPDAAVAERQQYLTLSVRDYLNERGKVLHAGETAGYFGTLGSTIGGIYYGLDGAPDQDCVVTQDLFSDCLLLADDFYQYYLGAYSRSTAPEPTSFTGAGDLDREPTRTFGGPGARGQPARRAGHLRRRPATSCRSTSSRSSPARRRASYEGAAGGAVRARRGVLVRRRHPRRRLLHAADPDHRPERRHRARRRRQLRAQLSFDTEEGYDHVIVEAHPVGQRRLDHAARGRRADQHRRAGPSARPGFLLEEHPFLAHYLTLGRTACTATGTHAVPGTP